MFKAVLFDLDGTLLDTGLDLCASCNKTLEHFGFKSIENSLIMTKVTSGMREMLKLGTPKSMHDSELLNVTMRQFFADYYLDHIADYTAPFPSMQEVIEKLFLHDIKIAIITNKYENMALKVTKKFPFLDKVSFILGCDSCSKSKPDPEPLLIAMQRLSAHKNETLYIGDHLNDIMAANRAQCKSAVALWGYGLKECADVATWNATYKLKVPLDILDIVLKKDDEIK